MESLKALTAICADKSVVAMQGGKETHVFGGLQVNDGQFPSFALGEQWQVSAGFDLQGRAEGQRQVGSSAERGRDNSPLEVTSFWDCSEECLRQYRHLLQKCVCVRVLDKKQ